MFTKRKTYIILFAGVLAAFILTFLGGGIKSVQKGYTEPLIPAAWKNLIYEDLSSIIPEVVVDGVQIDKPNPTPFVTSEFDVMVPVNLISSEMKSLAVISDSDLYLYRGNQKMKIDLKSDQVSIGGDLAVMAGITRELKGNYYISADFLKNTLRLDIEYLRSENQLVVRTDTSEYLPRAFSFREVNRLPEVLNQEDNGTCWAYASLTALESTLRPNLKYTFSRNYLSSHGGFNDKEKSGGTYSMAMAYLLSWMDPVDKSVSGTQGAEELVHVEEVREYSSKDLRAIKEAVFLYGGVQSSMYLAMADSENAKRSDYYYNADTKSYFYDGTHAVNHDVVIVGWDDDYDKSQFPIPEKVKENGAFLCQNSWGESFGDRGLFWVSYEDVRLGTSSVCFTKVGKTNNFANIYQSDLCGATASAGYGDDTAYFANVYTVSENENLAAVGFYTLGKNSAYDLYVVHDFTEPDSFARMKKIKSGFISDQGYFTIRLDEEEYLKNNEKFAVVVKIKTEGSSYPIAIEKKTETAKNVELRDGEGYISHNGNEFRSTEGDSNSNICLKAYTNRREGN